MRRRLLKGKTWAALAAAAGLAAGGDTPAATRLSDEEVARLEQRIAELEEQSRATLTALAELRRELVAARGEAAAAGQPTAPAAVEGPSREEEPTRLRIGTSTLEPYGFVRLDAIFDDSPPDHPQFPAFVLSEDPRLGPPGDEQLNLHPRLTRFGLRLAGPPAPPGGWSLTGNLEVDFQNGGRESRQVPRLRHGWLRLAGPRWSILAGQSWDVVSPLFPTVNGDSLMWNAGNLGDRRPQLRVTYEPPESGLSLAAALGLTGAIDGKDLDGDGIRDGDDSSLPNVQARLGTSGAWGEGKTWNAGLSGHYAQEETTRPVAGEHDFNSHSLGLDVRLALGERLTVQGEVWRGSNLSDFRGGIGQGIDPSTGEEIDSRGGWAELGLRATRAYSLFAGLTLDDPDDEDLPAGGRVRNRAWYLTQRLQLAPSLVVGLDVLLWVTDFAGLESGTDNRLDLYLIYGL